MLPKSNLKKVGEAGRCHELSPPQLVKDPRMPPQPQQALSLMPPPTLTTRGAGLLARMPQKQWSLQPLSQDGLSCCRRRVLPR